MFELLVTLCLGDICAERILPRPMVQDQAACSAEAPAHIEHWLSTRPAHRVTFSKCVEVEALEAAEVVEFAPSTYVHHGRLEDVSPSNKGDVANTGFIIGQNAVAVIDTGTTRAVGEALYVAIRRVTDKPIKYVILTHMHPDHVLGASVFKEAGATVIGAPKLSRALQNRAEGYLAAMDRLITPEVTLGTNVVLPDEFVDTPRDIDLGGRVLTLKSYATAHTSNDLTVKDNATNTIWMGDLVFLRHTPALDGSITGWITLLEDLKDTDITQMIPGHGPAPVAFPDGAEPTKNYLRALAAETRAAIAKGDSLNDALKHLGKGLKGDWLMFEEFNPRNATNAYVELEWE